MDLKRDNNNAWIVNKHINDVNLLIVYAKLLKNNNSIEDEKVTEFTELLKQKGLYNPRWAKSGVNIGTAQNKINELCFYMFGYKHEKKFIFSPLGNLYLEQENESTNLKYIFATMLWSMQYAHPHNNEGNEDEAAEDVGTASVHHRTLTQLVSGQRVFFFLQGAGQWS